MFHSWVVCKASHQMNIINTAFNRKTSQTKFFDYRYMKKKNKNRKTQSEAFQVFE